MIITLSVGVAAWLGGAAHVPHTPLAVGGRWARCSAVSAGAPSIPGDAAMRPPLRRSGGGKALKGNVKLTRKAIKGRVVGLYRQAQLRLRAGAPDDARRLLRQCLRLDSQDAHSWLSLARLEADTGESALARSLFEEAVEACPRNVRLLQARAVLEQRCGEWDEAERWFALAAEVQPGNPYVSHAWGALLERRGNASAAREVYAASVDVEAQPEVCAAWAALESQQGNPAEALRVCRRGANSAAFRRSGAEGGLAAVPGTSLLLTWATLEQATGNSSGARSLLEQAARRSPLSPKVWWAAVCWAAVCWA